MSTYKRTYEHTYKFWSTYKHSYKFGNTFERTFERLYVPFLPRDPTWFNLGKFCLLIPQPSATCILNIALTTCDGCDKF